jgi:hypothetical protein
MQFVLSAALTTAFFMLNPSFIAQGQTEGSRAVEGGGISVPGWTGTIDPSEQSKGQSLKMRSCPRTAPHFT